MALSLFRNRFAFFCNLGLLLPVLTSSTSSLAQTAEQGATRQELASIEAMVSDCLRQRLTLDTSDMINTPDRLFLIFDWIEISDTRRELYFAGLRPDEDNGLWQLTDLGVGGEQTLGNGDSPTYIKGAVAAATAEEIHQAISSYWQDNGIPGDIHISNIESPISPEHYCDVASEKTEPAIPYYEIIVAGDQVPIYAPVPSGQSDRPVIRSRSGTDGMFRFLLSREDRQAPFQVLRVECAGMGDKCQPDILSYLQQATGPSIAYADQEAALQAMLAVIPRQYLDSGIREIDQRLDGAEEHLYGSINTTLLADGREMESGVDCTRPFQSNAPWQCEFATGGFRLQLPSGQYIRVHSRNISTEMVDALVETAKLELKLDLATARNIMLGRTSSPRGFSLQVIEERGDMVRMSFDENLNLVRVNRPFQR